jgi:hypothetical protein
VTVVAGAGASAEELRPAGWDPLSVYDTQGPHQNRGLNYFHCCSWHFILVLYILQLCLQKGFRCLNLQASCSNIHNLFILVVR